MECIPQVTKTLQTALNQNTIYFHCFHFIKSKIPISRHNSRHDRLKRNYEDSSNVNKIETQLNSNVVNDDLSETNSLKKKNQEKINPDIFKKVKYFIIFKSA